MVDRRRGAERRSTLERRSRSGRHVLAESPGEHLRNKLADFYAQRTLTKRTVLPQDCANAIVWLLSDESAKITGHIIPVDGGLAEAFLR